MKRETKFYVVTDESFDRGLPQIMFFILVFTNINYSAIVA